MRMTSLTICRSQDYGDGIFSQDIKFKRKIWYPVKLFLTLDTIHFKK